MYQYFIDIFIDFIIYKCNNILCIFYSDSKKILNFHNGRNIALYVLIFNFLSEKLFKLRLKINFLKITEKKTI